MPGMRVLDQIPEPNLCLALASALRVSARARAVSFGASGSVSGGVSIGCAKPTGRNQTRAGPKAFDELQAGQLSVGFSRSHK